MRICLYSWEVVAGALGGGSDKGRRLDLIEALAHHVFAHGEGCLVAQADALLHGSGTQVEIAVGEASVFLGVGILVDLEGEGGAFREDDDRGGFHLDGAGSHVRIDHGFGPTSYRTRYGYAVLVFELGGSRGKLGRGVGVDDNLGDPIAVAEIDEGNPAVIALAMDPSVQDNG